VSRWNFSDARESSQIYSSRLSFVVAFWVISCDDLSAGEKMFWCCDTHVYALWKLNALGDQTFADFNEKCEKQKQSGLSSGQSISEVLGPFRVQFYQTNDYYLIGYIPI